MCGSKNLRVNQRQCNHSKFNGGHYTPSDWSEIVCLECGRSWRTKAKAVDSIADMTKADWKTLDTNIGRSSE